MPCNHDVDKKAWIVRTAILGFPSILALQYAKKSLVLATKMRRCVINKGVDWLSVSLSFGLASYCFLEFAIARCISFVVRFV